MKDKKVFYIATLALIVALGVAVYVFTSGAPATKKQGAAIINQTGVSNFEDVAAGDIAFRYDAFSIPTGTSTAFLINNAHYTRWIDEAVSYTGGTASSSFRIYMATSTSERTTPTTGVGSPSALPLYGLNGYSGIMKNAIIATGTVATSTINTTVGNHGFSNLIPWHEGEYLGIVLQRADTVCPQVPATGGCEAATSTNRGFDLSGFIRTFATTTVR